MSRAFVKESDEEPREELPELQVSTHRNFVTPTGLRQIESSVERLRDYLTRARAADDRTAIARIQRDLRYWVERLRTAEVIHAPPANGVVRFGSTVVLERKHRARIHYQIVGEDEADPPDGKISYVSPMARRLLGANVGHSVEMPGGQAEIVDIR
jgi:transcription elongation GreA/GreB family factor